MLILCLCPLDLKCMHLDRCLQKEQSIASICDQFETLEKQAEALKIKNGLSFEMKK